VSSARLPATSARARIAATGRRSCATNRISLGRQSGRPLGASPETRLGRRRPRWRVCAVPPSEHGSAAAAGACAFGSAGIGLGHRCVLTYRYASREIRIAPYRFAHSEPDRAAQSITRHVTPWTTAIAQPQPSPAGWPGPSSPADFMRQRGTTPTQLERLAQRAHSAPPRPRDFVGRGAGHWRPSQRHTAMCNSTQTCLDSHPRRGGRQFRGRPGVDRGPRRRHTDGHAGHQPRAIQLPTAADDRDVLRNSAFSTKKGTGNSEPAVAPIPTQRHRNVRPSPPRSGPRSRGPERNRVQARQARGGRGGDKSKWLNLRTPRHSISPFARSIAGCLFTRAGQARAADPRCAWRYKEGPGPKGPGLRASTYFERRT
jgi:hypothetical protein